MNRRLVGKKKKKLTKKISINIQTGALYSRGTRYTKYLGDSKLDPGVFTNTHLAKTIVIL